MATAPAPSAALQGVSLAVDVVEEAGDWSFVPGVETAVERAIGALSTHGAPGFDVAASTVCVVLANDETVRELNRAWRGKDKPTNVLSFPAAAVTRTDDGRRHLGDVILAAETLGREAVADAIPPVHHLQHLVVHGVLHLLGFDHETEADAECMEALEVEILARLGIADPYAARDGAPS